MRARIAESFARSLARLEGPERAAVKRAAFDFLFGSRSPGLHLHRLVHCEDPRFWSLRVNRDLRVIVHREGDELVLCYADHHDRAYAWAAPRGAAPRRDARREACVEVGAPVPASPRVGPASMPIAPRPPPPAASSPPPPGSGPARRLRVWRRASGPLPSRYGDAPLAAAPAPLLQLLQIFHRMEAGPPAPGDPVRDGGCAPAPGIAGARLASPRTGPRRSRFRDVALLVMAAALPFLGLALAVRARRAGREAERARDEDARAAAIPVRELAAALTRLRMGERAHVRHPPPAGEEGRAWAAIEALDRFLALEARGIRSLADAGVNGASPPGAPAYGP
jgi:hypothetical protein